MLAIAGGIVIAVIVLAFLGGALSVWAENDFEGCGCVAAAIGIAVLGVVVFVVWEFAGTINNGQSDLVIIVSVLLIIFLFKLLMEFIHSWRQRLIAKRNQKTND